VRKFLYVYCFNSTPILWGSFAENFEAASLPTTTEEERKRLLSFVVCGGGPTGVETAAEIYDLCNEDILQYYPKVCRSDVSIHVIQSREHILNTVGGISIVEFYYTE
jgi:NADH dehydrogenase FAD-containing subunit